jgi:methylenetetrahydrofolate reductase (NADPH)
MNLPVPVSYEFFPPKTAEQKQTLFDTVGALRQTSPDYVSVTFGAGGSTLSYTFDTVAELKALGLEVAPHLSCLGGTRQEIHDLLQRYASIGCRRIVALRGDMPSGMASPGEFRYASELVRYIRQAFADQFHIEVACYPEFHPQCRDALSDLRHFADKVAAGANGAITQYFFNAESYFRFLEDVRRAGIEVPIVPGIMPITNFSQLRRFSEMCGAEIPRWLERRLSAYADDASAIRAYGVEVVSDLCRKLIAGGAPGLHFYTLNRAKAVLGIVEQL